MAVSAILALSSCKEDSPVEELDGPTITWASNPEFGTVTIDEDLDATLNVTAPAGIKEFTVEVKSDIMEAALKIIGISTTTLDLINDETVITILNGVTDGQLPTGEALLDQKNVDFNITALVKMINKITEEDSDHTFVVKVIDNNAKSAEKSCTFHRVGVETPEYAAPTAEWVGHSFDDPMELSAQMDVKININAPAGFKAFTVVVESAPLNNMGISSIDMVNPGDMAGVVSMILGDQDITTATTLNLDLSSLVPMIMELNPENDSNHKFTFNVVDNVDQSLTKTCTFHYTGVASSLTVDENSVDLWANTVKLNVTGATSVAYREKGSEPWIEVKANENGEYIVAPEWEESKNAAELTVYTVKEDTGIFAGKTYEFQLNGETVSGIELTTAKGDVIPNGDMSGWSEYSEGIYPNAEGDSFWTSGNNGATPELCVEDNGTAKLASVQAKALGFFDVFAAGNLYTGSFKYSVPAEASFGQSYKWTARPKALKLRYKANIGAIDWITMTPSGVNIVKNETIDKARIYAVVTDWSGMHTVSTNPLSSNVNGTWDPENTNKVDEGAIIGYASQYITVSTEGDDFVELVIPFNWYDKVIKPTGTYSIVISCSASYLGDYLTGCSTNKLWVDDFEWVY